MDLSSPGRKAGPVTTLQSDLESAASPITAETHCSVKNGLPGDYSDKSLQGIHRHGQGHDIANVVRLRLECITDGQMKGSLAFSQAGNVVALAVLIVEFVDELTESKTNFFLANLAPEIYNIITSGLLLLPLLCMLGTWLYRIFLCFWHNQLWQHRRRRTAELVLSLLVVQTVNLAFFVVPNVPYMVCICCQSHARDELTVAAAIIRWSCWNPSFLIFCVDAHSHNPIRQDPDTEDQAKQRWSWRRISARPSPDPGDKDMRSDAMVIDLPITYHWPKLIIWALAQACVTVLGVNYVYWTKPFPTLLLPASSVKRDCLDTQADCHSSALSEVLVGLVLISGGVWFLLWLHLLYSGKRHLNSMPYAEYKLGNLAVRLQERSRWVFIVFFVVSFGCLWFGGYGSCRSILFVWLGLLPMQVLATIKVLVWAYIVMPLDPRQQLPPLQVELQQFSWSEAEHRQRSACLSPENGPRQFRFCFETAFKALLSSHAVYASFEDEEARRKLAFGYEMLELEGHEVIAERQQDTRALLGWGKQGIVLAFRGTASFQNAISDLQAWRSIHPTHGQKWRLGQPSVHAGFLAAWQASDFGPSIVQRVMDLARASLQQASHPGPLRILITGHSLGGALAQLAAYDLAAAVHASGLDVRLACYTCGAPRLGNTAFARAYEAAVPDTWNIINDQDVVARRGKFLKLYKRAGPRVIINRRGDLIVHPTYAEANVQRIPGGGSVTHHYLASYRQSLMEVCRAQFSSKRQQDGMQGVLALVQSSPGFTRILEKELGMDAAEMARIIRWGPQADRAMGARRAMKNLQPTRSLWDLLRKSLSFKKPASAAAMQESQPVASQTQDLTEQLPDGDSSKLPAPAATVQKSLQES